MRVKVNALDSLTASIELTLLEMSVESQLSREGG